MDSDLFNRIDTYLQNLRAARDWMRADYHHSLRPNLDEGLLWELVREVQRLEQEFGPSKEQD